MKSRLRYWLGMIGCVIASGVFLSWAIQAAWIGSLPGSDVDVYTMHLYWRLGASAACLLFAVFIGVRYRKRLVRPPVQRP